jgi:cell division protein FtsN
MARRKSTRRRNKQPAPNQGPAWLVLGLLIGLGIAAAMNWESVKEYIALAMDQSQTATATKQAEQPQKPVSSKPEFDFYDMLANKKVESPQQPSQPKPAPVAKQPVPQQPSAPSTAPIVEGTPEQVQVAERYIIQVASFSNYQDADRMRAQLTMSGFDVYIQSAQQSGKTLYRLNMGPYVSKDVAMVKQKELQDYNISSFLIKL